ncbi:MAG TPA: hypothetical protein VLC98_15665 [Phnomibacter sp.]|nr:hypothetical protein [Phnomibacter sp.]
MRTLAFILTSCVVFLSCKKDTVKAGGRVEIYLLKTFQTVPGRCQVDAATALLQDTPTVRDQDILAYSQTGCQFRLTEPAIQSVKTFKDFTPFAVTVDKQVIYYGFFKPGISSSSCDHSITMDIDWVSGDKISLKLGYPGELPGATIDDERNHQKLVATLNSQGKLK